MHFSRNLPTMSQSSKHIPFSSTHVFSKLINDYLEGKGTALDFVQYAPNLEGYRTAIEGRKKHPINRNLLFDELTKQYANLPQENAVNNQIALLNKDNTFVITTAHQPNLFTGPLYFFYKIIHAIQLAASLKEAFPECNFVPVYYMGSEDADLDEVGSFNLDAKNYQWATKQTGAIGRMQVDDALLVLLKQLESYWTILPQGQKALEILKEAYQKGKTISEATLSFVHAFFGSKGLLVLQPDDAALKAAFIPVMEKELMSGFSHEAIQPTIAALSKDYHVQSEGRSINLFYLKDNLRARIEKQGEQFIVVDTDIQFTEKEIIAELHQYPERFSPNVILRGVYQETILPGVVFVGGGGELAYWMELKNVFQQVDVHYPLLQLRNFSGQDFSKYHPGGALGKKLYLKCEEIATRNAKPQVLPTDPWKKVIVTITESRRHQKEDGFVYEKHKMFLYKEDFDKFVEGLNEAVNHVKTELMPDVDFKQFNREEDEFGGTDLKWE